jgi:hypothetical protein
LTNSFLIGKKALVDTGELLPRAWAECKVRTDLIVVNFGKQRLVSDLDPEDFSKLRNRMAKRWGPHRLSKIIQYVRSAFKHGLDVGLIDQPVRFGPGFNRPTKKTIRSSVYREHISDERLKAVTDHVRAWLCAVDGSGHRDLSLWLPSARPYVRAALPRYHDAR